MSNTNTINRLGVNILTLAPDLNIIFREVAMKLSLLWVDFYIKDNLFGIGILTAKNDENIKSLLSFYWNDGELLIDLFWFRIYSKYPFFFWWFYKDEK